MKREVRKKINKMIGEINQNFPTKQHGFERVLYLKLSGNDIEVHSADLKNKNPIKKKENTLISPAKKSHYEWADMLEAFLMGSQVPIYIFREYEKEAERKYKEDKRAEAKRIAIAEQDKKKALEDSVDATVDKAN